MLLLILVKQHMAALEVTGNLIKNIKTLFLGFVSVWECFVIHPQVMLLSILCFVLGT